MSHDLVEKGLIPRSAVPRNTIATQPTKVINDRITVVELISHQRVTLGERSPPVDSKYWRELKHSDQPYQRSYTVTEDSKPLDIGWAREWPNGIGMIHIANIEGAFSQTIPTQAEKDALAVRIVEVGSDWLIYPGESMRGVPSSPNILNVRCRSGSAKITVTVYPA